MKKLLYFVYAVIFNFFAAVLPVKPNRVAFVSMHNEYFNDSLGAVYSQLKKSDKYEFVFVSRPSVSLRLNNIPKALNFFLIKPRLLARAKYVFLNDNFLPMASLRFNSEAVITQLWHGEGVFKKFGLAINQPTALREREIKANKKLKYVVCSSKNVVPYYAQAFGVQENQVLPLGSARTDLLFGSKKEAREKLDVAFPQVKGKKLALYAPTFREDEQANAKILSHFDFELFNSALGGEYALIVKLHPQLHSAQILPPFLADATSFSDVCALAIACDVLITDYSSICMDFSFLDKKTVFFAYDLDEYIAGRDFYFDYASYVPGGVAKTTAEVISLIKAPFDKEKNEKFKRFNFDYTDGKSAQRIVDRIILS